MHNSHGRLSPAPWPASGQWCIYMQVDCKQAPASCWACLNLQLFFLILSSTYILYKPILFTCQAACCLPLVACCLLLVAYSPGAWACCHLTPKLNNKERTSRTHPEIFNLEILLVSPKVYWPLKFSRSTDPRAGGSRAFILFAPPVQGSGPANARLSVF